MDHNLQTITTTNTRAHIRTALPFSISNLCLELIRLTIVNRFDFQTNKIAETAIQFSRLVSFNLSESVNDDRNPKYPNANALIDVLVVTNVLVKRWNQSTFSARTCRKKKKNKQKERKNRKARIKQIRIRHLGKQWQSVGVASSSCEKLVWGRGERVWMRPMWKR